MDLLPYLFAAAVALASALAAIGVGARRRLGLRLAALIAAALFMPAAYAAYSELLSKPKPVAHEWAYRHAEEAKVLASLVREGEGIYLWLQLDGVPEPRAYVLPWEREQAVALQGALREAESNGTSLRMRLPFEPTLDEREPLFYAPPQPALPPKDEQAEPSYLGPRIPMSSSSPFGEREALRRPRGFRKIRPSIGPAPGGKGSRFRARQAPYLVRAPAEVLAHGPCVSIDHLNAVGNKQTNDAVCLAGTSE